MMFIIVWCIISFTWIVRICTKLLNHYGDVIGDYICICAYMLLANFLTCYWRRFDDVSMY